MQIKENSFSKNSPRNSHMNMKTTFNIESKSELKIFPNIHSSSNNKGKALSPTRESHSLEKRALQSSGHTRFNSLGNLPSQYPDNKLENAMPSYINSGNHIQNIEPKVISRNGKCLFTTIKKIGDLGQCKVSLTIKDEKNVMFRVESTTGNRKIYYLIFEQWIVIDKIKLRYGTYDQMIKDLQYNPQDDVLVFMKNYKYRVFSIEGSKSSNISIRRKFDNIAHMNAVKEIYIKEQHLSRSRFCNSNLQNAPVKTDQNYQYKTITDIKSNEKNAEYSTINTKNDYNLPFFNRLYNGNEGTNSKSASRSHRNKVKSINDSPQFNRSIGKKSEENASKLNQNDIKIKGDSGFKKYKLYTDENNEKDDGIQTIDRNKMNKGSKMGGLLVSESKQVEKMRLIRDLMHGKRKEDELMNELNENKADFSTLDEYIKQHQSQLDKTLVMIRNEIVYKEIYDNDWEDDIRERIKIY